MALVYCEAPPDNTESERAWYAQLAPPMPGSDIITMPVK